MGLLGGDFSTKSGKYRSDYILLVLGETLRIKSYERGHYTTWRMVLDRVGELQGRQGDGVELRRFGGCKLYQPWELDR